LSVFSFDSLDDLQQFVRESGDAALAAISEEQRGLSWGCYVMMPTTDFIIFGYVFTKEEIRLGEIHAGASQEEAESTVEATQAGLDRGRLFGRWLSLVEPDGELGYNHAVNCWPTTAQQHNVAATFGWDARSIVREPEGAWLLDKYIDFAQKRAES